LPTTIPIDTLDDPRVALYRGVLDRDLRGEHDCFVAESLKVVQRLLASRFRPASIFLETDNVERLWGDLDSLDASVPIYVASAPILRGIAGYHVHRGVLAMVPRPDRQSLWWRGVVERVGDPRSWTLLAANAVTHMDNVGALFRNAAALGVAGIILDRRCCDPLLRKPIRVAMGHSLHLPFGWCDELPTALRALRDTHRATIVALEGNDHPAVAGRAKPIGALQDAPRLVLVVGSEGHGIDAEVLAECDAIHEIPMCAGVPSLNVATAAAIAMHERAARSRR